MEYRFLDGAAVEYGFRLVWIRLQCVQAVMVVQSLFVLTHSRRPAPAPGRKAVTAGGHQRAAADCDHSGLPGEARQPGRE